jgi:hypothetical protein
MQAATGSGRSRPWEGTAQHGCREQHTTKWQTRDPCGGALSIEFRLTGWRHNASMLPVTTALSRSEQRDLGNGPDISYDPQQNEESNWVLKRHRQGKGSRMHGQQSISNGRARDEAAASALSARL